MISYRKANIDDVNILAKIRSEFLMEVSNEYSEDKRVKSEIANKLYLQKTLKDDSFVAWLALDDDKIIATSGLSFYTVPPNHECLDGNVAYIMNIYTYPNYRNQGIGAELFKRVVEEARRRGYKKITLNATNAGRPLYEKYGFRDVVGDMAFYVE